MDFEDTDTFKIMLSHRPDSFVFGQAADTWKIDLKVYRKDDLEYRRMNFMGMEESYGQYEEISQDQVKLYLKREFVHMINVDTVFVSLFAMEKRMLAKDAMVLHCSVLKVRSGVILFSGPSGIGKSTQAGLWTKYRKARVINGDRTLLKKENGRWMSLGCPICGSSEICYNEAYPVKAVFFLGQAEWNDGIRSLWRRYGISQKILRSRSQCLSMGVTWKKLQ